MSSNNKDHLSKLRHSVEHVLTQAMLNLYPGLKMALGPATVDGFYFDFEYDGKISAEDFPRIEQEMSKIIKADLPMIRQEIGLKEARKLFAGNPYKQEWLDEIEARGEKAVLYWTGEVGAQNSFVDLCAGPHVGSTGEIKAFKLLSLAGAYWHGDEKNQMLTRIYGTAFASKNDLEHYLQLKAEASKRDHKKLGKELDLFTFSKLVGAGLPLWTPKGTLIRNLLDDYVWQLRKERGYSRVAIPHITKKGLYKVSGHWDKFKNELFKITTREGHEFAMKPMNCPHHTQIYNHLARSYRDLPQRYSETTMCYRDEQSGELSGLSRVRSFTQDDAHVFCRESQVEEEVLTIWDIIERFYQATGFPRLEVRLSLHDPNQPDKYLGSQKDWQEWEESLRTIAKNRGTTFTEDLGEAAFYGPKIDFVAHDVLDREWQVATIQVDRNMPERFDLTYINENSQKERVVMIHAAIMGSIERFMSILIEHHAGAFPVWMAPVQAVVLPISDKHSDYARDLVRRAKKMNLRVEIKADNESLSKKIRGAQKSKVPYMLVVGDTEVKNKTVAVRKRNQKQTETLRAEKFLKNLAEEVKNKL